MSTRLAVPIVALVVMVGCGRLGFDPLATSDGGAVPDADLGDATPTDDASASPRATWAAGHGKHVCFALPDGRAYCAGLDNAGQLGDGAGDSSGSTPVLVAGDHSFASVTVGDAMSCGVGVDGSMWCWGVDGAGKLGNGAEGASDIPSAVVELPGSAIDSCAGSTHACAVVGAPGASVGDVYCWGSNGSGELGLIGPSLDRPGPPVDLGGARARRVACGFTHGCALTDDSDVYCWGGNSVQQISDDPELMISAPRLVSEGVTDGLAVGELHTCVLVDGQVTCRGADDDGQHGDGSNLGGSGESETLLPERAVDLMSGQRHSCAIGESGAVYCWGYNIRAQVSGGVAASLFEATPLQIDLDRTAVAIGAHELASCATLDDGQLVCWGEFDGQTGVYSWDLAN